MVLRVSRMAKRAFRRFDVTILIWTSCPHHAFLSHVMPVLDGPEGIKKGRAFRRFDVTILIAASHLHHAFHSHMISVVNIP
jgi:hypothetical protein